MSRFLFAIVFVLAPVFANAFGYVATGTVTKVQSQDVNANTFYPGGALGDWFLINGFVSAGACGKTTGGVVVEVKTDTAGKRQYNTALTALALGKSVLVSVDDTYRDANGYCYVIGMNIVP